MVVSVYWHYIQIIWEHRAHFCMPRLWAHIFTGVIIPV